MSQLKKIKKNKAKMQQKEQKKQNMELLKLLSNADINAQIAAVNQATVVMEHDIVKEQAHKALEKLKKAEAEAMELLSHTTTNVYMTTLVHTLLILRDGGYGKKRLERVENLTMGVIRDIEDHSDGSKQIDRMIDGYEKDFHIWDYVASIPTEDKTYATGVMAEDEREQRKIEKAAEGNLVSIMAIMILVLRMENWSKNKIRAYMERLKFQMECFREGYYTMADVLLQLKEETGYRFSYAKEL